MQTKNSIETTLQQIQDYAQNPLGELRVIDECPVGYHVRQGDLYIRRIESFDESQYKITQNRQLAPGTNKGSRHTVSDAVTVFERKDKASEAGINNIGFCIEGPVVRSEERFSVMHVEHADMSMPGGTYQIFYQVDPVTMRRVID